MKRRPRIMRMRATQLRYGMEYIDIGQQQYQQRYRQQQINSLRKRADALGYVLIEAQTGVVS